jgi:protein Mpv17
MFGRLGQSIRRRPILALSLTNGLLAGVSDVLAQVITRHNRSDLDIEAVIIEKDETLDVRVTNQRELDVMRTARFAAYGTAIGPIVHHWYAFLDRTFPLPAAVKGGTKLSGQVIWQVTKRMLGDQVLFAPVGLATFFTVITLFEGGGWIEIKKKLHEVSCTIYKYACI